jgi:hypothetical protein
VSNYCGSKEAEYLQEVADILEQSISPADPSVQFFGLEWSTVFSQCFSLGMELR